MSRAALLALSALLASCGTREVVVDIHTPAQCCTTPGCEPECPLAGVRSVLTRLERVDGTIAFMGCEPTPADVCRYEDLQGFVFLDRVVQPSEAVEVRIEGRTAADCEGELLLTCDSFGEHVVDLTRDDTVALFCDCPFTTGP